MMLMGWLAWLYNLEGWQLTGLFILMLIIVIPILSVIIRWIWSKIPEREKKAVDQVTQVDRFWGLSRAANVFFSDLKRKLNSKNISAGDSLYIVLTQNVEGFSQNLKNAGLEARLNKAYSSGSVMWAAFQACSFAIASPKIWNNESKYAEGLIELIASHRPERPIDGIVVDVSAVEILQNRDTLVDQYSKIKSALITLQRKSQMSVPVYFVMSECQAIPGFQELFTRSISAKLPLGLCAATDAVSLTSSAKIKRGLDSIVQGVDAMALLALADEDLEQSQKREIIEFPALFVTVLEGFSDVINDTFPFNSFEFSGDLRSAAMFGSYFDTKSAQYNDLYCGAFFDKILSSERNLAKPIQADLIIMSGKVEKARRRMFYVGGAAVAVAIGQIFLTNSILTKPIANSQEVLSSFTKYMEARSGKDFDLDPYTENSSQHLAKLLSYDPAEIRSFWLPASLWSGTHMQMRHAQEVLDREYLFTPLGAALQNRLNAVIANNTTERGIESASEYPAFGVLEQSIDEIETIETINAVYQDVKQNNYSLSDLDFLAQQLLGLRLPRTYVPALGDTKLYASLPTIPEFKINQLRGTFDQSADAFILDLLQRDSLMVKARRLALIVSGDSTEYYIGRNGLSAIIEIQSLINDIDAVLQQGRYDWLVVSDIFADPDFERILMRMGPIQSLGRSAAQEFERQVYIARQEFIKQLAAIKMADGSDVFLLGQETVSLNAQLIETQQFLDQAIGITFLGRRTLRPSNGDKNSIDMSQAIETLSTSLLEVDEIQLLRSQLSRLHQLDFSAAPFGNVTSNLDEIVAESARQLVFEFIPLAKQTGTISQLNLLNTLYTRADNFNATYAALMDIRFYLEELNNPELAALIDGMVWDQATQIVNNIYAALQSNLAYSFDQTVFERWSQGENLAYKLFRTKDESGLDFYLYKNIGFLETVVVKKGENAINHLNAKRDFETLDEVRKFDLVAATYESLKGFLLEDPSSTVEQLHSFIKTDLPQMSLGKCLLPDFSDLASGSDYFVSTTQKIRNFVQTSCETVVDDVGRSAIAQFISLFQDQYLGKFPFSDSAAASGLTQQEAQELIARFRLLERDGTYSWVQVQATDSDLKSFLRDMKASVDLLDRLITLDQDEDPVEPVLMVEFRTQRFAEKLAKYVSYWTVAVDDQQINQYSEKRFVSWNPNDPISLRLKWAKSSMARPQVSYSDGLYLRSKGDELVINIPASWAFLRLVRAYNTKEICGIEYRCIELSAPIDFVASDNNVLRGGKFKGFMDVRLMIDTDEVVVPDFPRSIPAPALQK